MDDWRPETGTAHLAHPQWLRKAQSSMNDVFLQLAALVATLPPGATYRPQPPPHALSLGVRCFAFPPR